MKQAGHRDQTYTKRHWRCERCGASGYVLIHCDDSREKADWRRQQSHAVQQNRKFGKRRCRTQGYLRWLTNSQELLMDPTWPA